jgi:hypothetical protein
MFERINSVEFPEYQGIMINMMPFVIGDVDTLPKDVRAYADVIGSCGLKKGDKAYLSINESIVEQGKTQRRPGIHTDGTSAVGWGGWGGNASRFGGGGNDFGGGALASSWGGHPTHPGWGGNKAGEGIWIASSDGRCRIWNSQTWDVNDHGGLNHEPDGEATVMEPSVLYWMGDRTPHESLPALKDGQRQWFRIVADKIGAWWAQHSTANPFGVQPNAPIIHRSKFE